MTDLRKAAEMALEALEMLDRRGGLGLDVHEYIRTKIEALRQALAQPETEPVYAFRRKGLDEFCTCDKRRYDELAGKPDLFEVTVFYTAPVDAVNMSQERVDETVKREHEPYGYLWFAHQMERRFTHYRPKEEQRIGEVTPIYTAPPKREWVGLTEDDVHDAFNYVEMVKLLDFDRHRPDWCEAFASACEATLRHKNGGNK